MGCSRQSVTEKKTEPAAEAKVTAPSQSPMLPNVVGCDWGTINQPKEKLDLTLLKQAGMDTVVLGMNFGWHGAMRRYLPQKIAGQPYPTRTFWNGRDSYDRDSVREVLNLVKQQHPTARIIFWFQVDTYPEWISENPDEALRNDRGEPFVVNFHFQRVGNDPDPAKREVLAWSFYSQKLRDDMRPAIKEFVKTVESSPGGDQVDGYLIGGAQDAQFYLWEGPNTAKAKDARAWSDYSKPAVAAWHAWLKKKYGTTEALSAAWNQKIASFDQAAPPTADSLVGTPRFHDPESEEQQRNWKEFIADGRVTLAEDIARMIRESASRPLLIGTSSSDNGARANMTANVRLMNSKELDFVNGPVRYNQRLAPASPGGALAVFDSFRLNNKPILFDLDYRTWKNRNYENHNVGPGYNVSARMVGRTSTPEELRSAWLRETSRIVLGGHSVFVDPVEGPQTHQDPLIQHEMSVLRNSLSQARTAVGDPTGAEVAVIYDERATDYLKGALGDLHFVWSSGQRSELDLSGVPYGYYYLEDFKAGKVPAAKLYIFNNLLEIDDATAAAIEKLKANNNVLCFLQGTGFNLQKKDATRLSQIIGMDVAPAAVAKPSGASVSSEALLPNQTSPGFALPVEWTAFGPFSANSTETPAPADIPAQMEISGIAKVATPIQRKRGTLDFAPLGAIAAEEVVWAFTRIESAEECEVLIGAGADWWMTWYLNGEKLLDTAGFGNEFPNISSDNFVFPLKLKKGVNHLAVRVKAGSRGIRLAVEGRDEIDQGILRGETEGLKLDAQLGLVVQDAKARRLANYPGSNLCGIAERKHDAWTSIFAGTHSLRRSTIAALAQRANAWRVAPIQYVVAANEKFLMVHPQLSGNVLISLKAPAALSEVNGALPSQAYAKDHLLDLDAYKTYLFALGDKETLPGSTPGNATVIKPGTLIQFDFTADAAANPRELRPLVRLVSGRSSKLLTGPGIADAHLGISGNGAPPQSLFLNAAALLHESEEQALSKAAWFGFKVSPSAGKSLALERLEFQIQRSN
ncbi:MAG: beta-galactosidase, partial [Verrucomicrobiota bacterium]